MRDVTNPFEICTEWFRDVEELGLENPTAVALSTVGPDGTPSSRMVLVRRFDKQGFQFFTNHESRKAQELAENPRAALLFYWESLHRQLRVTGSAERVSAEESDAYFQTRPRSSQIGAHASPQSSVIADRGVLEARVAEVEARFKGREVTRPEHWGGYRVRPDRFEFWVQGASRLHDRRLFIQRDGKWRMERLAP